MGAASLLRYLPARATTIAVVAIVMSLIVTSLLAFAVGLDPASHRPTLDGGLVGPFRWPPANGAVG